MVLAMLKYIVYILVFVLMDFMGSLSMENEDIPIYEDLYTNNNKEKYYKNCYEDLGCIVTNSSWCNIRSRPIVMRPDNRSYVNTTFILHTKYLNSKEMHYTQFNTSTIQQNLHQFARDVNCFVIVHGYLSNAFAPWVIELTTEILKRGKYNVITVDWNKGAYKFYPASVSNTRIVALELTHLLKILLNQKIIKSPSNIHLIGHSLGAHICGYVGEAIRFADPPYDSLIKRITGLDPAGPYFQNMPTFVKLDPTDAERVIVIHTDPGTSSLTGYGTSENSGHIDIFANDVYTTQPGCFGSRGGPLSDLITFTHISLYNLGRKVKQFLSGNNYSEPLSPSERVSCSHSRAIDYFIEAISSKTCNFVPFECDFFADFIEGKCMGCGENYEKCIKLDLSFNSLSRIFSTKKSGRRFLFFTNSQKPFCVTTYLVSFKLRKDSTGCSGMFAVRFHGQNKNEKEETLTLNAGPYSHRIRFRPGMKVTTLTFSNHSMPMISSIDFVWFNATSLISRLFKRHSKLFIEYVEIQNIAKLPHGDPIILCPEKITPIFQGHVQKFTVDHCSKQQTTRRQRSSLSAVRSMGDGKDLKHHLYDTYQLEQHVNYLRNKINPNEDYLLI